MSDPTKTDANQLLQAWQAANVPVDRQQEAVERLLNDAEPYVLVLAREVGALDGNAKVDGIRRLVGLLRGLKPDDLALYRQKIIKALKITTAEFNDMMRVRKGEDDDEDDVEKMPIYGGWIGPGDKKYLIEYCFNPLRNWASFAVRLPDGRIEMMDEIVIDGVKYTPVSPGEDLMVAKRVVVFPVRVAERSISTKEIAAALEYFLNKLYLFDDPKTAKIAAYFVMQTWLYDNFKAIAYLRAIGDKGSGKSELMRRIGNLCYRMTKASGADSVSTFFRTTTMYHGTVFFEEADLADGSGADNPVVKFVNLGAMAGNFILRSEEWIKPDGSRGFRTVPFDTFCPKLFAQRRDFDDDAVASRSLTLKLIGKTTQELMDADVPLEMNAVYWKGWEELTAMLLRWRLEHWRPVEREMRKDLLDPLVSPRMNQVTAAVKALASEDGDDEFLGQVRQVLRDLHQEEINNRSMTWEARVVEALWKMYIYPDLRQRFEIRDDGRVYIKIGDVAAIANNIADEMNAEGSDLRKTQEDGESQDGGGKKKKKTYDLAARRVAGIIRDVLLLEETPRTNKGFFCIWDDVKMEIAGRKYCVLPPTEKITEARAAIAQLHGQQSSRKPMQMGFDAGEEDVNIGE